MTNAPAPKPLTKGQIRCFCCRRPTAIRDGNWLTRQNRNVFICKSCQFTESKRQKIPAGAI